MTDIIAAVKQFTEAVGCTTDRYNVRQTALYIGLQLEEMAEKLESMPDGAKVFDTDRVKELQLAHLAKLLSDIPQQFKSGCFDQHVEFADRAAMLDADIDLAWVTIGSAFSQGADVEGAAGEVMRANLSKLVKCDSCDGQGTHHRFDGEFIGSCPICKESGLVAIKDENGKVKKPEGWIPPNIEPFVCKS